MNRLGGDAGTDTTLGYFRDKVAISQETGTSLLTVRVRAFSGDAAHDFATKLLAFAQTWVANQLEPYVAPEAGSAAALGEAAFTANCAYCHQVNGLSSTAPDGTVTPVLANPDQFVVSGAAPNLTHLMTRNTFAGATWDLLTDECRDRVWNASPEEFGALYLQGVTAECLNAVDLREWIRNAPAKKPMYASDAQKANSGGKVRGMPALGLNETQIDQIIAYLLERN